MRHACASIFLRIAGGLHLQKFEKKGPLFFSLFMKICFFCVQHCFKLKSTFDLANQQQNLAWIQLTRLFWISWLNWNLQTLFKLEFPGLNIKKFIPEGVLWLKRLCAGIDAKVKRLSPGTIRHWTICSVGTEQCTEQFVQCPNGEFFKLPYLNDHRSV